MRLKQINIINFGQFSNKSFDLPSKQINVFFGANEAGKSTTVAFIKQIMFGFHLRSNSSPFFEDYTPLAHVSPMGGSLIFEADDSEYELERLYAKGDKTKRGILTVKKDGQVVPENLFFDQIQNIDGSFYADSFIFNQEMLGQVSSLSQEDLLERIYYLGAADSGKLLEMRDGFEKEAGKLFKKTGKKPEVNRLLKQMEDDRDNLAQTQAEFGDYEELDRDLTAKSDELKSKQQALEKLQKRAQELRDLQKELGNYQTLLDLQKQVKDTQFDSENYQKAQDIMAQGRNLQKTIKSLKEQLADLDDNNQADLSASKKLVQQKPQLLQWQAEYKSCLQKADELKQEKEQILALSPDTKQVLDLTPEQIKQLQADYLALPKQENRVEAAPNSNDKLWYVIGAVLAVLGLILLVMMGTVGVIALITGLIFLGAGYVKGNKQNAAILEKQKLVAQKRQGFGQQYGLNPDNLDINNLVANANQYHLKENAEKANNEQLSQINQEVAQLATSVQNALKKPIEDDFSSVLSGIDKLEEKIDHSQEIGQRRMTISSALKQDQQDLKELSLQLQTLFAQANVKNMADYDAGTYRGSATNPLWKNDTDGLGFFWKRESVTAEDETIVEFTKSYGGLTGGANELIAKGFRHYVVTVATGVTVDVYITHMNTYDGEGNTEEENEWVSAQLSQLRQLRDYVLEQAKTNKRPAIIMGDTNMRYTRHQIVENLITPVTNAEEGFEIKDPWVELRRGGVYPTWNTKSLMIRSKFAGDNENDILCADDQRGEVVDKMWYINVPGASIRLKAVSCENNVDDFAKSTEEKHYSGVTVEYDGKAVKCKM